MMSGDFPLADGPPASKRAAAPPRRAGWVPGATLLSNGDPAKPAEASGGSAEGKDIDVDIGNELPQGAFLSSRDARCHLVLQGDGRLRAYQGWIWTPKNCLWESPAVTGATPGPGQGRFVLRIEADGSLNIIQRGRTPKTVWTAKVSGTGGASRSGDGGSGAGGGAEFRFNDASTAVALYNSSPASSKYVWGFPMRAPPAAVLSPQAQFDAAVRPPLEYVTMAAYAVMDRLDYAASPDLAARALDVGSRMVAHFIAQACDAGAAVKAALEARLAALREYEPQILGEMKGLQDELEAATIRRGQLGDKQRQDKEWLESLTAQRAAAQQEFDRANNDYNRACRDRDDEVRRLIDSQPPIFRDLLRQQIENSRPRPDRSRMDQAQSTYYARMSDVGRQSAAVLETQAQMDQLKQEIAAMFTETEAIAYHVGSVTVEINMARFAVDVAGDLVAAVAQYGRLIKDVYDAVYALSTMKAGGRLTFTASGLAAAFDMMAAQVEKLRMLKSEAVAQFKANTVALKDRVLVFLDAHNAVTGKPIAQPSLPPQVLRTLSTAPSDEGIAVQHVPR